MSLAEEVKKLSEGNRGHIVCPKSSKSDSRHCRAVSTSFKSGLLTHNSALTVASVEGPRHRSSESPSSGSFMLVLLVSCQEILPVDGKFRNSGHAVVGRMNSQIKLLRSSCSNR